MGQALIRLVLDDARLHLAGGLEAAGSAALGQDIASLAGLPPCGMTATDDALTMLSQADAVIDFTAPAATVELAALAAQARIVHIIGTTGLSAETRRKNSRRRAPRPIVKSGNMSLGINLLAGLVEQAAPRLARNGILKFLICTTAIKLMRPLAQRCCWVKRQPKGATSCWMMSKTAARWHSGRAAQALLALPPCGAARWSAIMRLFSPAENEQFRLTHRAENAIFLPVERLKPRFGRMVSRKGFTPCAMCWASPHKLCN
jgi:hypothetical protein